MLNKPLKIAGSEKTAATVDREIFAVNHFKKYVGDIYINQVDINTVTDYRIHRLKDVCETTVNIEIRHLKAIFNTAVKLGYLKSSPFNKIKHLKVPESDFPK
ncbi:MAG: hypothetical protein GY863_05495, partial [bacterium]|nr:hypothetical protein [bacterium]